MSEKNRIPQYLDQPFKLILWTIDELIILFAPFLLLLIFFNAPITGLLVGGVGLLMLKKLKGEQGHYFMYHMMYWYLPAVLRFRKTPSSHIREWIG